MTAGLGEGEFSFAPDRDSLAALRHHRTEASSYVEKAFENLSVNPRSLELFPFGADDIAAVEQDRVWP